MDNIWHGGCVSQQPFLKVWTLEGETLKPEGRALAAHPDGARGVLINGDYGLVLSCGDDGVIKAFKLTEPWEEKKFWVDNSRCCPEKT